MQIYLDKDLRDFAFFQINIKTNIKLNYPHIYSEIVIYLFLGIKMKNIKK